MLHKTVTLGRWYLFDLVRKRAMPLVCTVALMRYVAARMVGKRDAHRHLLAASRYLPGPFTDRLVCRRMGAIQRAIPHLIVPNPNDDDTFHEERAIVLKMPRRRGGTIEKGVLLIKFTTSFPFYYRQVDIAALMEYFYIVLEPSSAGYADPNILYWTLHATQPVIVESSEPKDVALLTRMGGNLIPVTFGSSDWVDPRLFRPLKTERIYNAVYVTSMNPVKRHHVLFDAIRKIGRPDFKVALVLDTWGYPKAPIDYLMDRYGVAENIDLFTDQDSQGVNRVLNQSRVNVLLSLKEGSNRSLFEGFFAGTPGIALKRNIGVNKSYINDQTGRLIDDQELAEALLHFADHWTDYRPREWAMEHIAPTHTTQTLNRTLSHLAADRGEPWTDGASPKVNAPELAYLNPEDAERMPASGSVISLFMKDRPTTRAKREKRLLSDAGNRRPS